jgi:hypothetical protein
MLEFLLMAVLIFVGLVLVPILLLGLFLKALLWVVLLPLRAMAALVGVGVGLLGFLAKGVGALLAVGLGAVLLVGGLLVLPLLPVLALVFMVWVIVRLFRPHPPVRTVA